MMLDQVVRYGYRASEVSPSSTGTYLAYDTRVKTDFVTDMQFCARTTKEGVVLKVVTIILYQKRLQAGIGECL